jgi:hypothetical protein
MKKVVLLALSLVLVFSICTAFADVIVPDLPEGWESPEQKTTSVSFSDVPESEWYHDYVYDLANKQVINGYPDGTFRPKDKITVGQFLKLIIAASVGDNVKMDLVQGDYDHWASPYLKVAENLEVLEHGEYKLEDLDREISRIEIVRILAKCDVYIVHPGEQKAADKEFTDTADLSPEDATYLDHAVAIGVIAGDPEGTFRPNDSLLRSECAKVIYTFTNRK